MEIGILHNNVNLEDSLFKSLLRFVDHEKKERISRFYRREDAQRCLLGDLLARKLISRNTGFPHRDITFARSAFGKPFLKEHAHCHFNISHAGAWIACMTDSFPVGIDIELVQEIDATIAERYFSPSEFDEITRSENKRDLFFDFWTIKESYVKFNGKGLSQALDSFSVIRAGSRIAIKTGDAVLPDVYIRPYSPDPLYKMHACAAHDNFPDEVLNFTINDVIEWYL